MAPILPTLVDRRGFLKAASVAGAALGLGGLSWSSVGARTAPSDQIRLGIIGAGSRGKDMMRHFLRSQGVRFTAVCDIYPPRFAEAREITGEDTPAYDDYRRLLDHAEEMDAVVVATPLSLHARHVIDSLDAGLHVYGEKAMAFTVAENDEVVAMVDRSGKLFQVGHQYRYAAWYRQAVRRIAAGEIGKVTHVYGYWHRNYNWRRPVPEPGLERQINWRLYREYSGGLIAELGSHHIDAANWIFGETPATAIGSGGIDFYPDGREVFDNVQVIYDYPGGGTLMFSSILGNHRTGYQLHVYGTAGTVELTLEDGFFYWEPIRPRSAVPAEVPGRRLSTATLATQGDMPYRGPGDPIVVPPEEQGDPSTLAAADFVACLRSGSRPFADELVGRGSAVAVALGNVACRGRRRVDFPGVEQPGSSAAVGG